MDDRSHRSRILELFEKHRAAPGAPYDERHFLDFLLANPRKTRAVYDNFRGLRRFNAFVDEVQLEFAVCFSLKDREANYSLPRFVDRVLELEGSRRGSLMSLNGQVKAGAGWQLLMLANLALLLAGAWLKDTGWALIAFAGIAVLVNLWFARIAWKGKTYLERLRSRIEAANRAGPMKRPRCRLEQ